MTEACEHKAWIRESRGEVKRCLHCGLRAPHGSPWPNAAPKASEAPVERCTTHANYQRGCPACAERGYRPDIYKPAPAPEPKRHKYVSSPDRGGCVASVDGLYCGMHRLAPVHRAPEPKCVKCGSPRDLNSQTFELCFKCWGSEPAPEPKQGSEEPERGGHSHAEACFDPSCQKPGILTVFEAQNQTIDSLRAALATAREEITKLRKFVSEAMHEADAEKASADRAERENEELAVSYNELKAKYNRAEERVKELEDMMVTSITPCEGACVDEDCDMVRAILAASAHKEGESR